MNTVIFITANGARNETLPHYEDDLLKKHGLQYRIVHTQEGVFDLLSSGDNIKDDLLIVEGRLDGPGVQAIIAQVKMVTNKAIFVVRNIGDSTFPEDTPDWVYAISYNDTTTLSNIVDGFATEFVSRSQVSSPPHDVKGRSLMQWLRTQYERLRPKK